jgi:hypothetical protein
MTCITRPRARAFTASLSDAAFIVLGAAALGLVGSIPEAAAQPTVLRSIVASGGAVSTNGTLTAIGTVGQPIIGATDGNGSPRVDLGHWASTASDLAAPQLTNVSPSTGLAGGGTQVTLTGVGFSPDATVLVDGVAAQIVNVSLDMQFILLTMPAHAVGSVPITVTTAAGSTTVADAFSFVTAPSNETEDSDGDGLSDACELTFGLDPHRFTDPGADFDADGRSNLLECQEGTHPRGSSKVYLAEGAANSFFLMRLAMFNPNDQPTTVVEQFFDDAGAMTTHLLVIPPKTRATTDVDTLPNMPSSFSTVIEADLPLVVDRSMTWDPTTQYGNHSSAGNTRPGGTWFFAEGATAGPFDLFYLLVNPGQVPTDVTLRYFRSGGLPPIVKARQLPPHSRTTIKIDDEDPALAAAEVGARIDATQPIVAERAMYASTGGQLFNAGAVTPGQGAPNVQSYFAEGATGFFDLYLLLINPDTVDDAVVDVTYLLADGTSIVKHYDVASGQRVSIAVANEDPRLRSNTMSMIVTANVPVLAERTMWWPSGHVWYEGHTVAGSPMTGVRWALADAETGGAMKASSYLLLLNTAAQQGAATVSLVFEDSTTLNADVDLPPRARTTVSLADMFPAAVGRRFSVVVDSIGATPVPIVVERATYWDAQGLFWGAGDAQAATRLR